MEKIDSRLCNEIFVRILVLTIYKILDMFDPIQRVIQPEEIWLYSYPETKSYCNISCLWTIVFTTTILTVFTYYFLKNDPKDVEASCLVVSLNIILTLCLTRLIKLVAGRPRPDFYHRCFPNGSTNRKMICNGNEDKIREGRLSFPSGHTSISFSGLGFCSLYLMGKLRVYELKGNGHSWRILLCLCPVVLATLIGISRTCDYHHHTADVLAGALLGSCVNLMSYHQYYPPFYSPSCDVPYAIQTKE